MPDLTYEELMAAIAPRSDQLNADDLVTGPITVRILDIRKVNDEKQPYHIDVEGYPGRPWKPCKTMLRLMAHVWSEEVDDKVTPDQWIGRRVTLFRDPEVKYGGGTVGGIRISHLSDIAKPYYLKVTITRNSRKDVTIQPIQPEASPEDEAYIKDAKKQIAESPSMEVLDAIGLALKEQAKPIQDAVRGAYKAKKAELKGE